MTWWCSARGGPWDWAWQAYPGVWLLVAIVTAGYFWQLHRLAEPGAGRRAPVFLLGILLVWLAADWPLGPLGAGYLASVHTVQWLLFSLAAPPLLLAGLPPGMLRRWVARAWRRRATRFLTRPAPAREATAKTTPPATTRNTAVRNSQRRLCRPFFELL